MKFIIIWNKIGVYLTILFLVILLHKLFSGEWQKWIIPDSKVHGANMGPIWVLSTPDGPHVGPMNLAIRDASHFGIGILTNIKLAGEAGPSPLLQWGKFVSSPTHLMKLSQLHIWYLWNLSLFWRMVRNYEKYPKEDASQWILLKKHFWCGLHCLGVYYGWRTHPTHMMKLSQPYICCFRFIHSMRNGAQL